MNDSEFIELLNLYLDHEISAADATRLEAEVQTNAARRRTYLEYCRMQKACALLAKDFATESVETKILAFETPRSSWAGIAFAGGGIAVAAACVALVLINRSSDRGVTTSVSDSLTIAAKQPAVVAEIPVQVPSVAEKVSNNTMARTVTVPLRRAEGSPFFAVAPLGPTGKSVEPAALAIAAQEDARAQLEWMKAIQLAPMQAMPPTDLRLDARSPLQPAGRTYTNGRQMQGEVQMSAFRFQK